MSGYLGPGKATFFDNNGDPLIGGQVWTLQPGSSGFDTLAASYGNYDDAIAGTNPQTNPIILDSRGEAVIIINQAVKMVVEDANVVGGHGTLIWSVDNVAVAAIGGADVGIYHFLNNSIVDGNDNTAVGFLTDSGANSYVVISSQNGNQPPGISAQCAGVTNLDLIISPQNGGSIQLGNSALINYQTGTTRSNIKLTSTDASSNPSIVVTSTNANEDLDIQVQGTGVINLNNPINITPNASAAPITVGTSLIPAAFGCPITATNLIIGSTGQCQISTTGNIQTSGALVASTNIATAGYVELGGAGGLWFDNSTFTHKYVTPTLAANKTWTLPGVDGASSQPLITDGSGNLTFGVPKNLGFSCGAYSLSLSSSAATTTINRTSVVTDIPGNMATTNMIFPAVLGWYRISFQGVLTSNAMTSTTINLRTSGGQPPAVNPYVPGTVTGGTVNCDWYVQVTGTTSAANSFYLEIIPLTTITATITGYVSCTLLQKA